MQQKQTKIHVSNLPNTTSKEHIIQYLQTAGPIKQCTFDESGQRFSAMVVYYDYQSAETAKKFLDQKEFNTRKIKITLDQKEGKADSNNMFRAKIAMLKKEEKIKLFRYLKLLRDQEGQIFVDFLDMNPWLVQELLKF